jgi:hypothetical protein
VCGKCTRALTFRSLFQVKGSDIPLLPRHAADGEGAGGGAGRQPRSSADEEVDQYLQAITVLYMCMYYAAPVARAL